MQLIDSDQWGQAGIETLVFPGGEPHVKVPKLMGRVLLFIKARNIMQLTTAALVCDAISRQQLVKMQVFIPYFPGARQDRSDGTAPLTVKVIASMFTCPVHVFDMHSPALSTHLEITHNWMPTDLDYRAPDDVVGIIAPDKGATNRAYQFCSHFCPDASLIQCSKQRDSQSGALTNYYMPPLARPGRYIIVDDICDGGGTFNLLAQQFAADPLAQDCKLELFVSHGIFSKGLDAIDSRIGRITTTDSWCTQASDSRLHVLPLFNLLPKITTGDIHV